MCSGVSAAVIRLLAHEVVIFAIPARHLHFVLVREHAHLLQSLMGAPDYQRNTVPDRGLNREHGLPRENRPVDAAEAT